MDASISFKPKELLPTLFEYRNKLDAVSATLSQITQKVGSWVNTGQGDATKSVEDLDESQRDLGRQLVQKDLSLNLVSEDYKPDTLRTANLILSVYRNNAVGHRRYEVVEDLFKLYGLGNLDRDERLAQLETFTNLVANKNDRNEGDVDPLPGLSLDGIKIAKPSEDAGERRLVTLTGGFFSALEDAFGNKDFSTPDLLKLNILKPHKLAVLDCLLGTAARYFEKPARRQGTVSTNLENKRFLVLIRAINYFLKL